MKALIALIAFVISLSGCALRYVGNGYGYMQGPPAGYVPPPLRVPTVRPLYAGEIGVVDTHYGNSIEVEINTGHCPEFVSWLEFGGMLVSQFNGSHLMNGLPVRMMDGSEAHPSLIPSGRQFTSFDYMPRRSGTQIAWKLHYGSIVMVAGRRWVEERGVLRTGVFNEGYSHKYIAYGGGCPW